MSSAIWFWLIFGLCLIFIELLIPGLVVIFLGIGALFIALLQWLGFLETWIASFTAWFISSLAFLILLRGVFKKFLPGEVTKDYIDEDEDAFGSVVDVIETVTSENNDGRIKFRGTSWTAKCMDGEIRTGGKAKIIYRDDMVWIVEPYDQIAV